MPYYDDYYDDWDGEGTVTNLPNIHEYETKAGDIKWAVCIRDERHAQYKRPLDSREHRLTGCSFEVCNSVSYFGGFTKSQAYSRAQTLFGYAKIWRPK